MKTLWLIFGVLISFVVIFKVVGIMNKKSKEKKDRLHRANILRKKFDQLIVLQDTFYSACSRYVERAVTMEDLVVAEKIGDIQELVGKLIRRFNKEYPKIQYFDDAVGEIDLLRQNIEQNWQDVLLLAKSIKDLRELHHGTEEERNYYKNKIQNKNPFRRSKYFKECTNKQELTSKYKQLVRTYHPDNGGDPNVFIQINEEYQQCQKQVK